MGFIRMSEQDLDRIKATPKEDTEDVYTTSCDECGDTLFEGDDAYKLDGLILCEDCGKEHCKNKFLYVIENPNILGYWED